jgi:murein DD-endopeptidase MepM/ murein hydrolase activator NlpD
MKIEKRKKVMLALLFAMCCFAGVFAQEHAVVFPVEDFGWRDDPFTGARTFHAGLDIFAPVGLAVKAAFDGRVSSTGYDEVYGNYIVVTHSPDLETLYAQLSNILVEKGISVAQGTTIGQVGNTGRSAVSHLHFSVYKNKRAINPLEVFNRYDLVQTLIGGTEH